MDAGLALTIIVLCGFPLAIVVATIIAEITDGR